jgi:glycosyltransferase involved in cell wall biosynthesis
MRRYLARAAVFVSPLRLGAGIKNKVLEALAMRCPVVATPVSVDGIAVLHDDEVLIAEGDDPLVEAALNVLTDPALGARLGASGRALIEARYSWGQVAERYEAVYKEVAATKVVE